MFFIYLKFLRDIVFDITISFGVNKLIDAISRGIGKLYEPVHLKRMASAQAFEINKISDSLLNSELPISYNRNGLKVTNGTEQDIARRASH